MATDWKREVRDQFAHMAVAALALGPAIVWPSIPSFAFTGFMLGAVREVTEVGPPVTLWGIGYAIRTSKFDLTFWTIGGALAAVVLGA